MLGEKSDTPSWITIPIGMTCLILFIMGIREGLVMWGLL